MFSVHDNWPSRETRGKHAVESCPISGVYDIDVAALKKLTQPQQGPNVITISFVQLVVNDSTFEALKKFASGRKKAQFMYDMVRRMVDEIDDAIFQTAGRKCMQNV